MKVIFNQGVNKIDISGLRALAPDVDFVETHTADDVAREIGDADSLSITNRVYLADMVKAVNENAKTLKWINFRTSGIDKALKHGGFLPGTVVTNATGLSAPTLSEHAFSLFMFLARNFRKKPAPAMTGSAMGSAPVSFLLQAAPWPSLAWAKLANPWRARQKPLK